VRNSTSAGRLVAAICLGIVAGGAIAPFAPWQCTVLGAWIVGGGALVAMVWVAVHGFDGDETRSHATREDSARATSGLVLVSAAVASLVGVGLDLVKANQAQGAGKATLTVVAVATVAVSWAVVHTVFTLRYAHEFSSDPAGGIDFKAGDGYVPDYSDFAYVAFTVGMTFQVSDTDITSRVIRHTVLRHALLAYLFGAVILAVTVNVIAGILQ
jgi:uncharacterized membrane protein